MSATVIHTVKPRRRDTSQHITPDLIGFYKKRAHELRADAAEWQRHRSEIGWNDGRRIP